jgi:hypothetical protein
MMEIGKSRSDHGFRLYYVAKVKADHKIQFVDRCSCDMLGIPPFGRFADKNGFKAAIRRLGGIGHIF